MLYESSCDTEKSNANPVDQLYLKEFIERVDKVGSYISMIEGKKINPTNLFSLVVENNIYRQIFVDITSSENFKQALLSLLYLYPSLVKSKITKSVIRKLNAKPDNRTRKTSLQQTSSGVKKNKRTSI